MINYNDLERTFLDGRHGNRIQEEIEMYHFVEDIDRLQKQGISATRLLLMLKMKSIINTINQ